MTAYERKERERNFHNATFSENRRRRVRGFYRLVQPAREAYEALLHVEPPGARVLEFGCGQRISGFALAQRGCQVTAIDISDVAIEEARREALRRGSTGICFRRMDAEALSFADGSMDLVCGTGILHHLDLRSALGEITRVLRKGGRAVFIEPLGHNPVLNIFRRLTPGLRTPDERPLTKADLDMLRSAFQVAQIRHVAFLALLAAPLLWVPGMDAILRLLHRVDAALLASCPGLQKYSWSCVIELRKPYV